MANIKIANLSNSQVSSETDNFIADLTESELQVCGGTHHYGHRGGYSYRYGYEYGNGYGIGYATYKRD
jgi:hypothetical protein